MNKLNNGAKMNKSAENSATAYTFVRWRSLQQDTIDSEYKIKLS